MGMLQMQQALLKCHGKQISLEDNDLPLCVCNAPGNSQIDVGDITGPSQ